MQRRDFIRRGTLTGLLAGTVGTVPDPLAGLVSWDLLVPCRRLWGRELPDCRQQTLEVEVLGRARGAGDIDGSRIPQTWFDFLASGRPGDLVAVLQSGAYGLSASPTAFLGHPRPAEVLV